MNKQKSVEEWKSIIETARSSGLTDKDWCLANGVSINTFYYNVRRLRRIACSVPKHMGRSKSLPQAVVPVEIVDSNEMRPTTTSINDLATVISINCGGMSISISNSAKPDIVSAVVLAARGASC